jgi:hypothetical protein
VKSGRERVRGLGDKIRVLTYRIRRCVRCSGQFNVCRPCYKGQWYCSQQCTQLARKTSIRRASKKYQASLKGREANSVRQRRFRDKLRNALGSPDTGITHHQSSDGVPARQGFGAVVERLENQNNVTPKRIVAVTTIVERLTRLANARSKSSKRPYRQKKSARSPRCCYKCNVQTHFLIDSRRRQGRHA